RNCSSRAGRLPLPGKAWSPSASRLCFPLRSRFSAIPRLAAASAKLRPCSLTSLTASILNSRVKVRRGLPITDLRTMSLHSFLSAHHSWGSPMGCIQEVVSQARQPFVFQLLIVLGVFRMSSGFVQERLVRQSKQVSLGFLEANYDTMAEAPGIVGAW